MLSIAYDSQANVAHSLACIGCESPVNKSASAVPALQYDTLKDKRIVVAVDGWEPDSMYPSGHYTRTLGPIGDRETETEASTACRCLRFSPTACFLLCTYGPAASSLRASNDAICSSEPAAIPAEIGCQ